MEGGGDAALVLADEREDELERARGALRVTELAFEPLTGGVARAPSSRSRTDHSMRSLFVVPVACALT